MQKAKYNRFIINVILVFSISNIVPKKSSVIVESKTQKQKTECNLELVSKSDSVFENIETVKSIVPYNFNFVEGYLC